MNFKVSISFDCLEIVLKSIHQIVQYILIFRIIVKVRKHKILGKRPATPLKPNDQLDGKLTCKITATDDCKNKFYKCINNETMPVIKKSGICNTWILCLKNCGTANAVSLSSSFAMSFPFWMTARYSFTCERKKRYIEGEKILVIWHYIELYSDNCFERNEISVCYRLLILVC